MLTLAPALAWGFTDRGLLRTGHGGRPQRLRPGHGRARRCPGWSTTCPAGGLRLEQRSVGFAATVVAGQVTIRRRTSPPGRLPGPAGPTADHALRRAGRGSAHPQGAGLSAGDDPAALLLRTPRRGSGSRGSGRRVPIRDHSAGRPRHRCPGWPRCRLLPRTISGSPRTCMLVGKDAARPWSPATRPTSGCPAPPTMVASGRNSSARASRSRRRPPGRTAGSGPGARRAHSARSQDRHRVDRAPGPLDDAQRGSWRTGTPNGPSPRSAPTARPGPRCR